MDHRLALGDLAALAVDRDEDRLVQRIGQECGQLLFAASAGIAGLALRETGVQRRPAGAHLVIVLVIRHMHLCYRYFRNVWVSKIVSTYHIRPMIVNKALPARSLRGRPASLRTFPECACYHLPKPLIWRVLLAIRSAISGPKRF